MTDELEQLQDALRRLRSEVAKVIIGQEAAIRDALIVLLTGQHALIEGVPGLGKTLLVRTLAQAFSSPFARIQFTPDLMPADITGTNVFNLQRNEFVLVPGPVFTTFLLADEVNRAPAKTQSALLEAMQERTVSIDRETHRLSPQLHCVRHPESHRVRGHVRVARGAERSVHASHRDDLAGTRGRTAAG